MLLSSHPTNIKTHFENHMSVLTNVCFFQERYFSCMRCGIKFAMPNEEEAYGHHITNAHRAMEEVILYVNCVIIILHKLLT